MNVSYRDEKKTLISIPYKPVSTDGSKNTMNGGAEEAIGAGLGLGFPYYEARAGHRFMTGAVTREWLAQAESARPLGSSSSPLFPHPHQQSSSSTSSSASTYGSTNFSVIEEFNCWRSRPELAEAVAAIKALTAVIKRSEATTMMGLEIELKKASEALKVTLPVFSLVLPKNLVLHFGFRTRSETLKTSLSFPLWKVSIHLLLHFFLSHLPFFTISSELYCFCFLDFLRVLLCFSSVQFQCVSRNPFCFFLCFFCALSIPF